MKYEILKPLKQENKVTKIEKLLPELCLYF